MSICPSGGFRSNFLQPPPVSKERNVGFTRQSLVELCGLTNALQRLDRIEVLNQKIKGVRVKISSEGKNLQACLYNGPPGLSVQIPWEGDRKVSVREATHLFSERRKKFVPQVLSGEMSELEYSEKIEKPIFDFYQLVSPQIQRYNQPIYTKLRFEALRAEMVPFVKERKKHVIEFLAQDYKKVKNSPDKVRSEFEQKMRSLIVPRLPHLKQAAKRIKVFLGDCVARKKLRLESGEKSKVDVMVENIERIHRIYQQYEVLQKHMSCLNQNSQESADLAPLLDREFFSFKMAQSELREIQQNAIKNGRVAKAIRDATRTASSFPKLPFTMLSLFNQLFSFRKSFREMSESLAEISEDWDSLFAKEYVTFGFFAEIENGFKKFKEDFVSISEKYDVLDKKLKDFSVKYEFTPVEVITLCENVEKYRGLTDFMLRKYEEQFKKYRQKHYTF